MKEKRVLATLLSACMLTSVVGMTACDVKDPGTGGGGGVDFVYNVPSDSKITIKIKNFGMGTGTLWLEETVERFAKEYQNVQYGDKTGVYLDIEVTNKQNTSLMATDATNIFFDENYSDPYQLMQSNLLLNLDSIVKDTDRVGGSLENKMFPAAKGSIMGKDGSYYALPHFEYNGGLSYNEAIFEEFCAYFAAEDEDNVFEYSGKYGTANFIGDLTAEKSVGPDGKADTNDDGLPASLDEFIQLCDYIKYMSEDEVSPLTVTGKFYHYYPDMMVIGLWTALAGAEQMRNYYNCTGEIEVVERDTDGNLLFTEENLFEGINYVKKPKTKWVTMKEDGSDGWMGNDMAAKYYALSIMDIATNEGFFSPSVGEGADHYTAQMDLYMDGKENTNKSAMLVEGSYWYNESNERGGFDFYEAATGNDRNDLRVKWMSLPTNVLKEDVVEDEYKPATFVDCGHAYTLVNKNVESNPNLKQACLDFVKFCYSEQELKNFTLRTGMARSIDYDYTPAELSGLSVYTRSIWESRDHVAGSNVVNWSGTTSTFNKVKRRLSLQLDCGVLSDGLNKQSLLFKSGSHVKDVFSACSMYGNWKNY